MPVFLDTTAADFEPAFQSLLSAKREDSPDVDAVVAQIIEDVRARGDAAVIELTAKFDRLELTPETMAFSADEIAEAVARVTPEDRAALELAADRIRAYHEKQMPEDHRWTDEAGATLGWRWSAVSAAGLYVPGGLASYPSSASGSPLSSRSVRSLPIRAPVPSPRISNPDATGAERSR